MIVRRILFPRHIEHPGVLQSKQRFFEPCACLRRRRNAEINGHAGGMHRELVSIARLKISRSGKARHDKPYTIVCVILLRKPLDEEQHFRARVRERDVAEHKVFIALHDYERP